MKDGGPAFPQIITEYDEDTHEYTRNVHSVGGMSLRDWFAGMALPGILASRDEHGRNGFCEMSAERVAKEAGMIADAMIAERENTRSAN